MPRWPATLRDCLVVLLTLTTGAVDAVSFLGLGRVFSSVITGNLVLLGVSAGTSSSSLAIHSGVALAGYSAGVLAAAPVAARHSRSGGTWPRSVTITLAVELGVLAGFSAGWDAAGGHPAGGLQLLLVAMLAASMGMQSVAVRRLGQMSSTYLTSTLTAVLTALATRTKAEGLPRSLGVLIVIVAGAFAGAILVRQAPGWLPALVLIPLGSVVIFAVAGFTRLLDR